MIIIFPEIKLFHYCFFITIYFSFKLSLFIFNNKYLLLRSRWKSRENSARILLLPETVPFLAKMLEDEDEATEKCAQNAIRTLEEIFGESLQKYF